jgi:MATE family multidrug resistance protein
LDLVLPGGQLSEVLTEDAENNSPLVCHRVYNFLFFRLVFLLSTRVSNELGAGRPRAAGLATRVVMFLAFSVCVSEGLAMVLVRNILGYAYSNDDEVAKYTARLMPALAVCILFDGLQNVLSGKQETHVLDPYSN